MSIRDLIDAVVRCTKCGGPVGCACWVTIRCPCCERTMTVERIASDGDASVVDVTCPECVAKD